MKTGDNTFDDILISKKTGDVVGVTLYGRDYKLVPFTDSRPYSVSYQVAFMRAKGLFMAESNVDKAVKLVNYIYGKEDESRGD